MSHQPNVIASRALAMAGIVLGVGTALTMLICWFLWRDDAGGPFQPVSRATAPALQARPTADLDAFRARQARSDGYGWVDPGHRVARIPVRRAMEIMATEPTP